MASLEDSARMLRALLRSSHLVAFEELPDPVARHAGEAGLHRARIYVADVREEVLRQVTGRGLDAGEGGQEVRVDATLPGRVFRDAQSLSVPAGGRVRHWLPVLDGTERLGVLRVDTVRDPDDQAREAMRGLASMVGMLPVSKRHHSDSYARLTRISPMTVSAETQWTLMPPRTFTNTRVTITAAMEPAYEIGGDAFDYAVTGTTLHLAVFDAMGHDATAGLTANVTVAACRNARRQGADLAEASRLAEKMLIEQFGTGRYATGVLADLDMATGQLSWVNRGHPLPVLVRTGRWSSQLRCPPAGPMGTDLGLPITVCHEQLQPGDRVVLYTDGITEARDTGGHQFGLGRFVDFILREHSGRLTLHETLRRLVHAVLEHHAGRLDDDATVLLVEWGGGHQEELTP
ncbi:PP2C family protein-serine/threonine phosphatase [Streptomyces radiopugnans]|uniref:PP2C family protein-serine/threonine phosphatase n=1 Tax=Streptomyces radiopugnans TaxID=403935 RepID=UPI003F1A6C0E